MIIYDKAHWQIDAGEDVNLVIEHFQFMFDWLNEYNLLSDYGKEILEDGIDEDVILNDEMLNSSGQRFLNKYYDKYISEIEYGKKENRKYLEDLYYKL